jgi:large subunit ribosomal protein L19
VAHKLVEAVEAAGMKKRLPKIRVGDTVDVSVKIVEGDKTRTQVFSGTIISRKGSGINESITVRRIVAGEGIERIFPLHAPSVVGVKATRKGHVRRAKLYFLRGRVGKRTKLREVQAPKGKKKAAAKPAADAEAAEAAE